MDKGCLSGDIYDDKKYSRVPLKTSQVHMILSKSAHGFKSNEDLTHLPES